MNESELRNWMEALPTDKNELKTMKEELERQAAEAGSKQIEAVSAKALGKARDHGRKKSTLESQIQIIEQELNR